MDRDEPVSVEESERLAQAVGLPREPFGYLRRPGRMYAGPTNPAGLFVFTAVFLPFLLLFLGILVSGSRVEPYAVIATLGLGAICGSTLWMGVRRLQWKRAFIAATGRRPW